MSAPLRITAIVAIHNEEHLVAQCLSSIAQVADELLVAHDGPCRDRSVEIARTFTDDVFVFEKRGAPETHLIKLLHRARHPWVLRLDCDEALSPGLIDALRVVKARGGDPGISHYTAIWRAVITPDDESPARPKESATRRVLFAKAHVRWLGIPHNAPVYEGAARQIRECMYHYAPHQKLGAVGLLVRKMAPFAAVDASLRLQHPVAAFNYEGTSLDEMLRPVDRWRARRPLIVALPLATLVFVRYFVAAFSASTWRELKLNLRWPPVHASYQLMLAWQIHKLRRAGHRGSLDPAPGFADAAASRAIPSQS